LFGEIVDAENATRCPVSLSIAGEMIARWWSELPNKFPTVNVDEFIVMPNHIHGIIWIVDSDTPSKSGAHTQVRPYDLHANAVGAGPCARPDTGTASGITQGNTRPIAALSTIVQWFKTMTTNEYIRQVKHSGWPPFPGKLWQRNYFEHVVRNEDELAKIRQYIADNPYRWAEEQENPLRAR
jgi:putative transposase